MKAERAVFKTLTPSQKWQQFLDYYLLPVAVAAFVIIVVIFLLWNFLSPHTTEILNVAVFDDVLNEDGKASLISALGTKFDIQKHESITISDNYDSATDGPSRLSIYMNAGQVDAVIAEKDIIQQLAEEGIFKDMPSVLDGSEVSLWNAGFVDAPGYLESEADSTYDSDGTGKGEIKAYGIELSDSEEYRKIGTKLKDPVFAFSENMSHKDHAVELLKLLKGETE